jgi:hypothetical protein
VGGGGGFDSGGGFWSDESRKGRRKGRTKVRGLLLGSFRFLCDGVLSDWFALAYKLQSCALSFLPEHFIHKDILFTPKVSTILASVSAVDSSCRKFHSTS